MNTSLKNWETNHGKPRCAAISAFGFSGTNAHIVIQEAPPIQRTHKQNPGYLIVVSAQTSDQLTLQIKHLLEFCKNKNGIELGNISYTLLIGRKHLNHRWGCVVRNIEELVNCLTKWLDKCSVTQVYTSILERNDYSEKISLKKYGEQCLSNCLNSFDVTEYLEQLSAICDLFVQGCILDVRKLFGEGYSRIALPTYPFAKGKYWVDILSSKNIYESYSSLEKVTLFLKQQVAEQVQKPASKIDAHLGYFDMGITSIGIVQIAHAINKLIDPEFSATQFFEYPTISALAGYLATQSPDAINRMSFTKRMSLSESQEVPIPILSENGSLGIVSKNKRISKVPASFQQQRLWFIDQYQGHSFNYHNAILITLHGTLNEVGLEKCLQEIIKRHESLRTNFIEEDGKVVQIIRNEANFYLQCVDFNQEIDAKESMKEDIQVELSKSFNLEKDLLIRVKFYKLSDTHSGIMINIHHIISDGWSLDLLAKELSVLYRAWMEKKDLDGQLMPLQIQYSDYADKQRKQLTGEILEKKLSYWKERLNGIETLELLTTYKRPSTPSYRGDRINFEIERGLVDRLEHLCQSNGGTLFMGLLAIWSVLLKRYSNQEMISIGTPVANRNHAETERLIGFFVNTIVLRQDLHGNPTFIELLNRVKENTINDFKHQDTPLEKVIDALNLKRDESRSPLFQVMMVLQNDWGANVKLPEISMDMQLLANATTKFDLTIELNKNNGSINGAIEYAVDLFDKNFIGNMIQHFLTMADCLVSDPSSKIDQVNYLKPEEVHQLIVKFNQTESEYSTDKCIHELFKEQAKTNPNRTALMFENKKLTYQELDQKSTELAIYLQSLGVKPDDLIGICTERSLEMIIGILGVLKSGGAFVPLDPDNPKDRLEYMLSDSKIKILLTQNKLKSKIMSLLKGRIKILFLDRDWEKIKAIKKVIEN